MEEGKRIIHFDHDPFLKEDPVELVEETITSHAVYDDLNLHSPGLSIDQMGDDLFPHDIIVEDVHLQRDIAFGLIYVFDHLIEVEVAIKKYVFGIPERGHGRSSDIQIISKVHCIGREYG